MSNRLISADFSYRVPWIGPPDAGFHDGVLWRQMREWLLNRLRAVNFAGVTEVLIVNALNEFEELLSD